MVNALSMPEEIRGKPKFIEGKSIGKSRKYYPTKLYYVLISLHVLDIKGKPNKVY